VIEITDVSKEFPAYFFRFDSLKVVNCIQQNLSGEAINHPAGQYIPYPLLNLKVYYHVHKDPATGHYPTYLLTYLLVLFVPTGT
jgi:hypothetical protein